MKANTILQALLTILLTGTFYYSYTGAKQIQALRQENAYMWLKIDSLQRMCCEQPQSAPTATETTTESTISSFLDYIIKLGEEGIDAVTNGRAEEKVVVTTKYSLEDRYVSYKVTKPEIVGEQTGEVVLNILVDHSGDVKSAKLKSATGITNEDVIEACKKAALKTDFNYDSDKGYKNKQAGTITYIFSAN